MATSYNVRRAPSSDPACQRGRIIPVAAPVTVYAQRGVWRWTHDEVADDWGWIHSNALTSTPPTTVPQPIDCSQWYTPAADEQVTPYGMTTTASYNVRRAPASDAACQRGQIIPASTAVTVHGERGPWRYTHDPQADDWGWIHSSVLTHN